MTTYRASLGPARKGASLAILVGHATYASAGRARQWADAVVRAAGGAPVAQLGEFSPDLGDAAGLIDAWSRDAADATTSRAVLDGALGGLRGHTLVWLARGADVHGAALVLHAVSPTISSSDVVLDASLAGAEVLLAAVRRSRFERLVLLGCEAGPALDPLATALRARIERPVYFTRRPVAFSTANAPTIANAHGAPWFAATQIALTAAADRFFAGTEGRAL